MVSQYLSEVKELVKAKLTESIGNSNPVEKSMVYSAIAESKMVRAGLIFASSEINSSLEQDSVITLAASIELMHTYSLIHDDLPCMDDDDIRRNQPSNHIKYGEANAVLSGDALQALSYEIICNDIYLSDNNKVKALKLLSQACGKNGMVLGQHLDIENENNLAKTDQESLDHIHQLKTGKLIECSVLFGQLNNDLNDSELQNFKSFSRKLGLAFQIIDDVLDVTESSEILGKNNNSDIKNNKDTYVNIIGVEASRARAKSLIESSVADLNNNNLTNIDKLVDIAYYLIERRN
ncbi:polyprenyl synthetase family protein [Gammaproteobacteria bacterium]|jgi:geranylgeranyl diphosphate synthase type II|nr:polyprenyl synthetase family protein [Gammaproteobacteria bacterium]MDB9898606.1 polyprenyl synthetase family protein [Gammaproteobacteria bacterium]